MKQGMRNIGLLMAVLGGGFAFGLRHFYLNGSATAEVGLWVLSALAAAMIGALSWAQKPRGAYVDCFSSSLAWMILSLLGAGALLVGNGMMILQGVKGVDVIIAYLGLVASGAMAVVALSRVNGRVASIWIHAMPCVYLVVKLIFEFRQWSIDPSLMDYCFTLFAAICTMLATCHVGYFVLDKGRRRTTIFWCLLGTVFSMCALADGGIIQVLLLGGMGLWVLANGGQLLEEESTDFDKEETKN